MPPRVLALWDQNPAGAINFSVIELEPVQQNIAFIPDGNNEAYKGTDTDDTDTELLLNPSLASTAVLDMDRTALDNLHRFVTGAVT